MRCRKRLKRESGLNPELSPQLSCGRGKKPLESFPGRFAKDEAQASRPAVYSKRFYSSGIEGERWHRKCVHMCTSNLSISPGSLC